MNKKINVNKELIKQTIENAKKLEKLKDKLLEDMVFYNENLKSISDEELKEYLGEELFNQFKSVNNIFDLIIGLKDVTFIK